jgi:glutamate 5-kinase
MKATTRNQLLGNVRRMVVKIGNSVIADLPVARIRALAAEVAVLRQGGVEIIVVTCGSIDMGMTKLALKRRPKQMPLLQAASAVGQVALMQSYDDAMGAHGIPVAQVLLTHDDLLDRARFLRARHTLMALLDYGVVPVINENDSVAVSEIIASDNDFLAARIPRLVEADLLVVLTTAEGIYETSPRKGGRVIPMVEDLETFANRVGQSADSPPPHGSLASKIHAALVAASDGVATLVASGVRPGVLSNLLDDETLGTVLLPSKLRRSRKQWIAEDLEPKGTLKVSEETQQSLINGNHSLLAANVLEAQGLFQQGDAVKVVGPEGIEFARGLVGYGFKELNRIQGKDPCDIEALLGYKHYDEVIRRNDIIIL